MFAPLFKPTMCLPTVVLTGAPFREGQQKKLPRLIRAPTLPPRIHGKAELAAADADTTSGAVEDGSTATLPAPATLAPPKCLSPLVSVGAEDEGTPSGSVSSADGGERALAGAASEAEGEIKSAPTSEMEAGVEAQADMKPHAPREEVYHGELPGISPLHLTATLLQVSGTSLCRSLPLSSASSPTLFILLLAAELHS